MSERLLVRPLARGDFEGWLPLWEGYNAFYGRVAGTALPRQVTETTWERFFDPGEPVRALVAEAESSLVGLAHYLFHRSTIARDHTCYLQDLFTDDRQRGKGIGRALIEAVYRDAEAAGAVGVYWHTHESNATAMRLYDQVADNSGFVVYRKPFGP